jgi:hypothetical protein
MAIDWCRCTHDHKCRICDHPDFCSVDKDGKIAACMRVKEGSYKSIETDLGECHLHRLRDPDPAANNRRPVSAKPSPKVGPPELLDRVYRALLDVRDLRQHHREALRRRGLSDEYIDRRGYRSLAGWSSTFESVDKLRERFTDEELVSVPGFVVRTAKKTGNPYLAINALDCLLIPVEDFHKRILGICLRPDVPSPSKPAQKYVWLSSKGKGGPSSGTRQHPSTGLLPVARPRH